MSLYIDAFIFNKIQNNPIILSRQNFQRKREISNPFDLSQSSLNSTYEWSNREGTWGNWCECREIGSCRTDGNALARGTTAREILRLENYSSVTRSTLISPSNTISEGCFKGNKGTRKRNFWRVSWMKRTFHDYLRSKLG